MAQGQLGFPEKGCSIQDGAGGTGPQSPSLCCAAQGGWAGVPLPSDAESGRQTGRPAQHGEVSGGLLPITCDAHSRGGVLGCSGEGAPLGTQAWNFLGPAGNVRQRQTIQRTRNQLCLSPDLELHVATIKHALGSCLGNYPRGHPSERSDLGLE